MISQNDKRITEIDIAKALGIICIVLGHVLKTGIIRQFLYAFSVPFFFFLIGLTYKYKDSIKKFYVDKLKRIVIPYLFFSLVSILIFNMLGKYASSVSDNFATTAIFPNLCGALYGNSRTGYMKWNIPLWFLTCLLACYFLIDSFERFVIRKLEKKNVILCRCAFILCGVVFSNITSSDFIDIKLPLQFETAFLMSSFAQLGVLFIATLDYNLLKVKKNTSYIFVCIVVLVIGGLMSILNGDANAQTQSFGKSICIYIASALCFSIGFLLLSLLLARVNKIAKFFAYIGKHTMGILLMHKFPILLFQTIVPVSATLLVDRSNTVLGIIWGGIVTIIVIALCLLVEKVTNPILPWIFGNKEKSILFIKKDNVVE